MQDNERTFENICKFVGKLVLDFHFDMDKLGRQQLALMEKLAEKEKRIRELENGNVGSGESGS